jgi:adenosine deaminase
MDEAAHDEHYQFVLLEALPKVELHAHLNGCIRKAPLFELAKDRGVTSDAE